MEKEKPEVINEELLNHVAGGMPDNVGSGGDVYPDDHLHVVGEDRDDLHADYKDLCSDKIHRQ